MPWTCRLLAAPVLDPNGWMDMDRMAVGDMFPVPLDKVRDHIADYYLQHNAARAPLAVILPGKIYFLMDSKCFEGERGYYGGWQVDGIAPIITVTPSINFVGGYHGYLTKGVITDDCEGRKFTPDGARRIS